MCALKPPFRADDMQGLYKKVLKGQYPKIPTMYSNDLSQMIKIMLQVSSNLRPDCEALLKLPLITKRLDDKIQPLEFENSELLKTIKIPKHLYLLTDQLPKPTYAEFNIKDINKRNFGRSQENSFSEDILPRIKSRENKKIDLELIHKKELSKGALEINTNNNNNYENLKTNNSH